MDDLIVRAKRCHIFLCKEQNSQPPYYSFLQAAFRVFDKQNRGKLKYFDHARPSVTQVFSLAGTIHPAELRHILKYFGETMEDAEIEEYLAEADSKCAEMK